MSNFATRFPFDGDYPITQLWGENPQNYKKYGRPGHNGIDWGMPNGTPILAGAPGRVIRAAEDNSGYGRHVRIEHADGWQTIYGHLRSWTVRVGEQVAAGQVIGYSNNTGNSTGPHLHFEVRHNNIPVNPAGMFVAGDELPDPEPELPRPPYYPDPEPDPEPAPPDEPERPEQPAQPTKPKYGNPDKPSAKERIKPKAKTIKRRRARR